MFRDRKIVPVILMFLFLEILTGLSLAQDDSRHYFIRAGKVYTATRGVLSNAAIEIKDGKIVRVGQNISIPGKARVLQAAVVMPGLIDIHSHIGVYSLPMVPENADFNEMTNPVTPQVRAIDSFNFDDPAIPVARAEGVTTIVSRPGSANVIGGTSVAVKLKTSSPDQMMLREICDLKMAIEGNPLDFYGAKKQMPATLMSVYFLARKAFIEAQDYMRSWEEYEKNKASSSPPRRDLGKEIIVKALKREIPVHIHCATASEIINCIRLAREFNLRLSLAHCSWAHLVVNELANYPDVHYNVGPAMFMTYYNNVLEFKNTPAVLANAGLKVSLHTDAVGGAQQNLLHLARLCYRYGMKEEDTIKAITINGAEAVGLENRIGSIEEGKDADLIFLDGHPLEFSTSVVRVIIDGKTEFIRETRLPVATEETIPEAKSELEIPEDIAVGPYAIKAGTIFTMAGKPIKDGFILISNGKIERVGKDLYIPDNYKVVDAREFVVMPGLISARSYSGILSNWRQQNSIDETSSPVVPALEVKHAVEPQAPHFAFSRQAGITTIMITPGNKNVIGGQGIVTKTWGEVIDKMIVKDRAVMVFGLGAMAKREDQIPMTRMGVAALLRDTLTRARYYLDSREKAAAGQRPPLDLNFEALIPVLKGEIPVIVHCERSDDILTAIKIADEFGLKIILDGATSAYKLTDELKNRNIPVIIEDLIRGAGNIEDRDFNPAAPGILVNAGIRVAFRAQEGWWVAPGVGWGGGDLLELGAFAVRHGMKEEAALRALTIGAAEILGIEHRTGSLEPDKDADILILRGHPFKVKSIPEAVFIDGKLVYKRKNNEHL